MQLSEILSKCEGGEIVDLTGKIIEPFFIRGRKFAKPVTLAGGRYEGTKAEGNQTSQFRFDNAANIFIEQAEFVGPDRSNNALFFYWGKEVGAKDCSFEGFFNATSFSNCDGFAYVDNRARNLRRDMATFAGCRRGAISRNFATDFFPVNTGGAGDHPDFIQLWPLLGSDNSFIDIEDNVYVRGEGLPVQGLFVRGVYPDRPRFGILNVRRNLIDGALYNGIAISGCLGGECVDNIVLTDKRTSFQSWLDINNVEPSYVCERNIAEKFIKDADPKKNTVGVPNPPIVTPKWEDFAKGTEPYVPIPEQPEDPNAEIPDPLGDHDPTSEPKPTDPAVPTPSEPVDPEPEVPATEEPAPSEPGEAETDLAKILEEAMSASNEAGKRIAQVENLLDQARYHYDIANGKLSAVRSAVLAAA